MSKQAERQEDANQRLQAKLAPHRSELQFRRLLEKLPAGAYTCDPDGLITYFNSHAVQLWGRAPKLNDPVDRFCGSFKLFSTDGAPIAHDQCWMALALKRNKEYNGHEIVIERPNGEHLTVLAHANPIHDNSGKLLGAVNVLVNITPIKEYEKQLERLAHYDALTHLPNRVLLTDRLQQAMIQSRRRGRSLVVAYLDLDGFKEANDKHGHHIGDELLILLSQRIKAVLREGDTLSRLGGDEFVAVLPDLDQSQDWKPMLTRLLQVVAAPVTVDNVMLQISVSMGVTLYPQDRSDADQLIRHADQAMYVAKRAGKNCYHLFDVEHDAMQQNQRERLERLHRALEQREFTLYYQPKVNLKTGEVIGAEALIRWQHPEYGLLLPAAFLPLIEEQPLSVEVGEWVIDTALTQMVEWHTAGFNLSVSVNVNAQQLQQVDFVSRLSALLAVHPELEPRCLELEMVESRVLDDMVHISNIIRACHAMGVHFVLDDFGTGYSSLTYLKRLPVNGLKIDQSFVRGMVDDLDDLAIVKGVIGLGAAFHREVIAEGVETAAHSKLLLSLGCERGQGYGIARPMPAADLSAWMATWRLNTAERVGRFDTPPGKKCV